MTEDTKDNIKVSVFIFSIMLIGVVLGFGISVSSRDNNVKSRIAEIVMETKGQEIVGVSEIDGSIYITTRGINCKKFVESDLSASSSITMWSEQEYKLCTNSREEIRAIN